MLCREGVVVVVVVVSHAVPHARLLLPLAVVGVVSVCCPDNERSRVGFCVLY